MASRRGSFNRAVRAGLWGLAVVHVAEALRLRQRREALRSLPDAGEGGGAAGGRPVAVWSVAGTGVDEQARDALRAEMDRHQVGVIDLVPADLPPDRWLRLLRRVDPQRLGRDPIKHPGGADEAVALHPTVAERMGTPDGGTLDRGTLTRLIVRAQRYSPGAHTVRVAPGVRAGRLTGEERWRELEGITAWAWPYGAMAGIITGLETAHLLAMTAGALVAPAPALAALATWTAQAGLVLAPRPGEEAPGPGGLGRAMALRLPRALALDAGTIAAGYRATRARAAARAATPLPPALPHHEQFEPRRDTCPWCGSASLVGHHDVPDLLLHKPGHYHLDTCRDCGTVFQNPRLTSAGLGYIYDNAYDGTGAEMAQASFSNLGDVYRSRAASIARHGSPRAILDVGTAHAHFMLVARQRWPDATVHALDMSGNVNEAQQRGWVDAAFQGQFQDLAGSLPRSYDLVVMSHYLEHVPDPRGELAAATKVLDPGGLLMIETPEPTYPYARLLGRYWYQWAQPEHLQLMPWRNMVGAVEEAGFEVLDVEWVTVGGDTLNAVGLALQHLSRSPHLPWLPDPGLAHRVERFGWFTLALPLLAAAKVIDTVKDRPFVTDGHFRPDRPSNSYRIMARRV